MEPSSKRRSGAIQPVGLTGWPRNARILRCFLELLEPRGGLLVAIEGYSYGAKGSAVYQIAELGGCLRLYLHSRRIHWIEVSAPTIKQFAAGSGKAAKEEMRLAVYKRWGFEARTNDEVDAFALAELTACALDWWQPATQAMERPVATVRKLCAAALESREVAA